MKKLLSIALVLVFALSLAAPALAYTDITDGGSNPYEVDIYLVDYSNALALFGGRSLNLPATNRAYGVNEVVAAVASFTVPANADILDTYGAVRFSTNNISMSVTDNMITYTAAPAGTYGAFTNDVVRTVPGTTTNNVLVNDAFASINVLVDDDEVDLSFDSAEAVLQVSTKAQKYSFLVFGKVLDEDADISIELRRNAGFTALNNWASTTERLRPASGTSSPTSAGVFANAVDVTALTGVAAPGQFLVLNSDYIVFRNSTDGNRREYFITDHPTTSAAVPAIQLIIEVDKNNATLGVLYYDGSVPYRVYMTPSGDIVISNAITNANIAIENRALYNKLLNGFNVLFEDLGLTLSNRTNIMKDSFWTSIANSANIKETVTIDPLALPYIQVPEVEVKEPPKTGSAASILGFVIIAMAGVAAVVVRKVRA